MVLSDTRASRVNAAHNTSAWLSAAALVGPAARAALRLGARWWSVARRAPGTPRVLPP